MPQLLSHPQLDRDRERNNSREPETPQTRLATTGRVPDVKSELRRAAIFYGQPTRNFRLEEAKALMWTLCVKFEPYHEAYTLENTMEFNHIRPKQTILCWSCVETKKGVLVLVITCVRFGFVARFDARRG